MTKTFIVYILTNASRRTLYTGISSNISRRMFEHKHKVHNGFTAKYNVNRLVYYERFSDPGLAIEREKEIKGWRRARKIALIEAMNPRWDDLAREWGDVFKPEQEPRSFARVSPAEESAGAPPSLRMTSTKR